ncbi:MAG: dihydroorotate dehydrogenase [Candidatus Micrarchaeota archaeon]|nr:dihydroorotate dehydrogenase [Candidatus Micrarchaeota archaeon]
MADLSVQLPGARLRNPLVLASGIRGNNAGLLIRAAKEGAGAVTSKSCSLQPREGHANPTALAAGPLMLNAIGLSNPGVDAEAEEIRRAVAEAGVPVIASVYAHSSEDFAAVAQKIALARPALIELDISCPNVHREGEMFSSSIAGAESVTRAVKAKVKNIPISVKLAPNVPNIGAIARAAQAAGADCITAINTMPALWIDAAARKPVLANQYGGMSGPALKPIALRAVYEIRRSCSLPIIGGGGITTGTDAAEMLMAGATAVSIGSAVYYRKNAFGEIREELEQFMDAEGFSKIPELKLLEK